MSGDSRGNKGRPNSPTPSQVSERLARVEEKQDHVVEQIDRVANTLDEDLSELEAVVEEMQPRHERLWYTYQTAKWVTTLVVTGGLAGRALGII